MPDTTALALYRAIHKSTQGFDNGPIVNGEAVEGALYPDFYARKLDNGSTRKADVSMYKDKNQVEWVRTGGGTSLWDKNRIFGAKWWWYFTIPSGTELPDSLTIVKGHYDEDRNATHYQIEAKSAMTKDAMKGALDNLARCAIVRSIELSGKTSSKI